MGQCCPIQCATPSSEWENTVPRTIKLNNAVAGAEKWHLRVCLLKFKWYNLCTNLIEQNPSSEANSSLVSHDILHINTFYYQRIAQKIILVHIQMGLLQHVMAISYSYLQGAQIYERYISSWYLTLSAVNGKQ